MLLTTLATICTTLVCVLSVVNVIRNKEATPHPFSRFVWLLISTVGLVLSFDASGFHANTLPLAVIVIDCLIIWIISLRRKHEEQIEVHPSMLFLVAAGLVGWLWFDSPLLAALCIVIVEVLSTIPTLKNMYRNPRNEIAWYLWAADGVGLILGLFALKEFDVAAALYPLSIVVMSTLLAVIGLTRGRALLPAHIVT
jgi:hypothetical protein